MRVVVGEGIIIGVEKETIMRDKVKDLMAMHDIIATVTNETAAISAVKVETRKTIMTITSEMVEIEHHPIKSRELRRHLGDKVPMRLVE